MIKKTYWGQLPEEAEEEDEGEYDTSEEEGDSQN